MKSITTVGVALVCVVMVLAHAPAAEEMTKIRVGVLNLDNLGKDAQGAERASDALVEQMAAQGMVEIYDEERLAKALAGVGRKLPERCSDPRCVLDLGGMLNLDRMVYGSVDANETRCAVHLYLMDITVRVKMGEASVEGEPGTPIDSVIATAVAMLHGRSNGKEKPRAYYGPEVHNEKQMLVSSGVFISAGLIWGLVNYNVSNKGTPLSFESRTESLTGIASSADQVPMFARPAALANAYVAASDDAYGVLYNPAGMAWLSGREAIVGYQYRFGLDNIAASFVNKATRELGFGHAFLYSGDRDGMMSEIYFVSAFAYKFNRLFSFIRPVSFGINLKMATTRIKSNTGGSGQFDAYSVGGASFGGGMDLGLLTEFSEQIRYGLLLRDVPVINRWKNSATGDQYYEALATTLHMGGTYQAGYTTMLICEGQIPIAEDQAWKMSGGIEQEFFKVIYGRIGLQKEIQSSASIPTGWKITWGFGLKVEEMSLDASHEYNTFGMFDVLNVSFRMGF
ncbi:MAG: hypothetical protein JW768_11800 [Chitinispirillaceae bacterium]|nr:hypothetical protein [Chitinispirillaceae bacterium]